MKKRLLMCCGLLLLTTIFQACGREIEPQASCFFVQNSSLQRVSWKDSLPVKLFVHQSVPQEYYEDLRAAVKEWNLALEQEALKIIAEGSGGASTPARDGSSVIYWLDTWEADKRSEQARTTVYWSGNKIYEADVRINDKNFDFSFGEDVEPGKVDFKSLMVHELGHVLGLSHNNDRGSVMNVSLASGAKRDEIGDADKSSIKCEY